MMLSDCTASSNIVTLESAAPSLVGTSEYGVDIAKGVFFPALASNDRVTIQVRACDNASPTYASSDNCSLSSRTLSVSLPDVDPPPLFSGIVSLEPVPATSGALRASWSAPVDWTDYRGFKIYSVTSAEVLTALKDCICAAQGCASQPTSCDISGLDPRRSYDFYIRAYDGAGNYSPVPSSPYAARRNAMTLDLAAPTFVPTLNVSFNNLGNSTTRGVAVAWSAATDNQYVSEPGAALTYKVYRKVGSTFAAFSSTTPPSDGTLLVSSQNLSFLNPVTNLTANTTEYYTVCAVDASANLTCDPAGVKQINVPRLSAPSFIGLGGVALGRGSPVIDKDKAITVSFAALAPETADPSNGATSYPVYITEVVPPATAPSACNVDNAPVLEGSENALDKVLNQAVSYAVTGLSSRMNYGICVKAKDSFGNESNTSASFNLTTQDVTAPVFGGVQSTTYNTSTNKIDLVWTASTSLDVKNYNIKIWKMVGGINGTPGTPVSVVADKVAFANGYSISKNDFAFSSNDVIRVVVNACDDAAPTFNSTDNCTLFSDAMYQQVVLPDTDPPFGFTGVTSVSDMPTRTNGAVRVTWAPMGDWSDVRGFKIYDATSMSPVTTTLLKDCPCSANACPNQLTTCDVSGLNAGKTYKFYVRAYDAIGNESLIANPNDIVNNQSFRSADLISPVFNSALQAVWESSTPKGIRLNWQAGTDNQAAATTEPGNTVGYRVYRKQGSSFSAVTRATIESEGTLQTLGADTNLTYLNTGLTDGVTYYYTVCAFDREPQISGGNTTCDGVVRSVTTPDTTNPVISSLAGSRTLLTETDKSFNLSWALADNATAVGQITVKVYRNLTTLSNDFPAATGTPYRTGAGLSSLIAEEGIGNTNMWLTYRIRAEDLAGNFSETTFAIESKRTPLPTDIGVPSVSVVNASGEVTLGISYTGATFVADDATFLSKVTLNTVSGNPNCVKSISGTGLAGRTLKFNSCAGNGVFNVTIATGTAKDTNNNDSGSAGPSANIQVDTTPPVLVVSSPTSGSSVKAAFSVSGSCESGSVVQIVGVNIASSPVITSCTSSAFVASVSLGGIDASNAVTVSQSDSAGNLTTAPLTLTKDTVGPVLNISAPLAGQSFVSTTLNSVVQGFCETNGTNVSISGDATAAAVACVAGAYSFSTVNLTSGDGSKTITANQADSAGNISTASVSVLLDTTKNVSLFPLLSAVGLKAELKGNCVSSGFSFSATSTYGSVKDIICAAGNLTVNLSMPGEGMGSGTVTATATKLADGTSTQATIGFSQRFFCPTGYVGVPGKFSTASDTPGLGNTSAAPGHSDAGLDPTRDFCIMKYPAKVATSNSGGQSPWEPVYDGNKTFTMANYWPESRASSTPWVSISRDNAIDRCKALNEAQSLCTGASCYTSFDNSTFGYRLMSNTQWQVVARNLEATGANWTSGTPGAGFLWRGHSDAYVATNTDLLTQTFNSATRLSNPRSDAGNSDYFGTDNTAAQNSTGTSGWVERRRFVLSTGASVWDMAGNVWQWVSENRSALGISAADDTAGLATAGWLSYLNGGSNRFSATGNKIFGSFGSAGMQFSESVNAGQILGGAGTSLYRGGMNHGGGTNGLFGAGMNYGPTVGEIRIGFRCAFVPSAAPAVPLDTGDPSLTVTRVNSLGSPVSNAAVTVSAGGFWNLGISVSDDENAGREGSRVLVQVRRKIASGVSAGDFPVAGDAVYRAGYLSSFRLPDTVTTAAAYGLPNETAWVQEANLQFTRNDGKYVNYLVTATDESGNSTSATYSVENTQSCPLGYVGVPGLNGSTGAWNDPALNAGLGNTSATAGNSNKQLDISSAFCVMKYPAKVMSAGTTLAQTTVGGLFEPIKNGNQTFANTYIYTNPSTFDSGVTYLPESRPSSTPWVNITRDNSINACRALQMQSFGTMPDTTTGTGFQLLSNTQWQMVARNAESVAANWSNNAVGSGVLNRGHSDNIITTTETTNSWCMGCTSPSTTLSAIPNSVSDVNSYFATGNSAASEWRTLGASPAAGAEQKRTHTLSNGTTLWDMAGNVFHWVSDNNNTGTGASGDLGLSSALRAVTTPWEYNNTGLTAADKKILGGFGGYTSSVNAGQVNGGSPGGVLRGGPYMYGPFDGLFSAHLNFVASLAANSAGFRCTFVP